MRILLLCHEYPPVGGGAASVSQTLAESYAVAGHDVVVVTMGWRDLPGATRGGAVEVHRIACFRRRREQAGTAIALLWAQRALRWCRREHAQRPFDVVHAHFVMPAGIVARCLRDRGVPYVLTAHGSDVPGFDPRRFRLAHRLVRSWWRRICTEASCLVAPSGALQELLAAAAPGVQAAVVANPIDVGSFATGPKEHRMLVCGRLVERKGFAWFFRALRGLELPGWSLDVVGDGPLRGELEAGSSELRVPVRFHGWIERSDPRLRELFGGAAIFVFPSLRENLPMVLLEAMAAGCAVVATDLPGNVEAVGSSARLVRAGDLEDLRRAVTELVEQPERRHALGTAARQRAEEEFGDQVIAARYLERLGAALER